jgi:hypothetical protein
LSRLSRTARRRVNDLAAAVDKVTAADKAFFQRRPGREHRARLASVAEIETAGIVLDASTDPLPGGRWVILVRRLADDVRLRVLAQSSQFDDLDAIGEDEARAAYRAVCRPGSAQFEVERKAVATLRAMGALS